MITDSKPTRASPSPENPGLFSTLMVRSPLAMAALDGADHVVRMANPEFCRLMGTSEDKLRGKPFAATLEGDDPCRAALDSVYRTGQTVSHTDQETRGGRPAFASYTIWPVMGADGPTGVMLLVSETTTIRERTVALNEALMLGSLRQHELTAEAESLNRRLYDEIAERKQATEALHRAQAQLSDRAGQLEVLVAGRTAELTATNQQLEAFVYSIAHDLRAPLRSMQGFAELLLENAGTALSETGRDFAKRISKSAEFMDAMLIALLEFSRVSQQTIELGPVKTSTVVEKTVSCLHDEIRKTAAEVEHDGSWPTVVAHEPTLTQVMINLLGNALKFTRVGVPPKIRIRAEENAGLVRVWVEDNGVGIEPAYRAEMFRLFTRMHGDSYPGTGIGLAIVQKGIERLGGRSGVDSQVGQGSRFWVELRKA